MHRTIVSIGACLIVLLLADALSRRENSGVFAVNAACRAENCVDLTTTYQDPDVLLGLDGSGWNHIGVGEMAGMSKVVYVRGVYDGLMFGGDPGLIKHYYTKTSYRHLTEALDRFYSDYRNEKIVVVAALRVVSMEMRANLKNRLIPSLEG